MQSGDSDFEENEEKTESEDTPAPISVAQPSEVRQQQVSSPSKGTATVKNPVSTTAFSQLSESDLSDSEDDMPTAEEILASLK
jgi:hypothetical protein